MKRILMVLALVAFAVSPAAAQWAGVPVWNNPKGGTGVTISGDLGMPNSDLGNGTAFGARATLGLANLGLTAGLTSWKPKGAADAVTTVGANVNFGMFGVHVAYDSESYGGGVTGGIIGIGAHVALKAPIGM